MVSAPSFTRVKWYGENVDFATSSVDIAQQGHSLFPRDVGNVVDKPLKLRLQISHGELKPAVGGQPGCRPAFRVRPCGRPGRGRLPKWPGVGCGAGDLQKSS